MVKFYPKQILLYSISFILLANASYYLPYPKYLLTSSKLVPVSVVCFERFAIFDVEDQFEISQ